MSKKDNNNREFGLKGVAQNVAHSESEAVQYATLRGQVYWFKRRAPKPLSPGISIRLAEVVTQVGKNGYVTFSLGVRDPKQAKKAALKYAHLLDCVVDSARGSIGKQAVPASSGLTLAEHSESEIKFAAESMYAALLHEDEIKNSSAVSAAFAAPQAVGVVEGVSFHPEAPVPHRYSWSGVDLPDLSPAGDAELIRTIAPLAAYHLLLTTGKMPSQVNASLLPFAQEFRRFVSSVEARKAGKKVTAPPMPQPLASWDELLEYYFKKRDIQNESTQSNYRLAWTSLQKSAKCAPAELTYKQVLRWLEEGEGFAHLHPNTKNNRRGWVKSVWELGRDYDKIPRNVASPFAGLRAEKTVDSSRIEFSIDELVTIFAAPTLKTRQAISVHAGYWLPLLALFQGARRDELFGLEVADFVEVEGTLAMHIRVNNTRPTLKNKSATRFIPVHPKLIELGFKHYVDTAHAAGVKQLFPCLSSGPTFGEEYSLYVRELLHSGKGRPVGMHCFRHSWETACRNAIPEMGETARKYLGGRKMEKGSEAGYGTAAGIPKLQFELKKVSYPSKVVFHPAPPVTVQDLKEQDAIRRRAQLGGQMRAAARATKSQGKLE